MLQRERITLSACSSLIDAPASMYGSESGLHSLRVSLDGCAPSGPFAWVSLDGCALSACIRSAHADGVDDDVRPGGLCQRFGIAVLDCVESVLITKIAFVPPPVPYVPVRSTPRRRVVFRERTPSAGGEDRPERALVVRKIDNNAGLEINVTSAINRWVGARTSAAAGSITSS